MDAVEDVKSRLNIEDVIGEYVLLKRAGRNFRGLSPFSSEKTPSFMVSPEKQIWHDFSSGKGGDIFSFVMEVEGLDFKSTLELLARKAGVDLSDYESANQAQNTRVKQRLYKAIELATKFYQVQFTKQADAIDYVFKKRGFNKQTVIDFRIGYSPNTGDALKNYLIKQDFTVSELQQAGLVGRNYNQPSDQFRGRLMIPLSDNQGRVIGFSSRILDDRKDVPKYINTAQSLLYDKSRNVYGFDKAKEAIRSKGYAVIVEGNLDVIASHQVGVKQVVATAGTAITSQHLRILANLTSDIRLAFDQDKAGRLATERAIPIASAVGVNLSIISIENAKDPDDLIKDDPSKWAQAVEKPIYAIDWLINTYSSEIDISSATGKRKFTDILMPLIAKLSDPVESDHYTNQIAELLKVSKTALNTKTENIAQKTTVRLKKSKAELATIDKETVEHTKNQDQLLALVINNPILNRYTQNVSADMLISEGAINVLNFIKANPDFKDDPSEVKELNKYTDYVKMLMLLYESLYHDLDETELIDEAKSLQDRLIIKYVKLQKKLLSKSLDGASEPEVQSILKQAKNFDNLLRETKEARHGG